MRNNCHFKTCGMWLCVLCLVIVTCGCAPKKSKVKEDPFYEKWKTMAEESKGYSPKATKRSSEQLFKEGSGKQRYSFRSESDSRLPTRKITLKLQNIDLSTLLRSLARMVDKNIIINESVKGFANINVKDAAWNQLFTGILRSHGLTYAWEGDLIRVMTLADMDNDFKRESQLRDMKMVEPLITQIINIDYSDANKLKTNIESFLTKGPEGKPRGSVMVDEHTNSLIVQAIRDDIARIIALVNELDRPTPQILIEAHIVETNSDTARELGVQWGGLYHRGNQWITSGANATGVTGVTLSDSGIDPTTGMASNFPSDSTAGNTDNNQGTVGQLYPGLAIGFVAENAGKKLINVQLSALQEEGKLNILSSPSITTIDNQKAIIKSGEEVPVQTYENQTLSIEWKEAVLQLEVTPHVIDGETLKMVIKTKKDELDFSRTVQGNPTIIKKEAETNIILLDGETTVIGGLNKERTSDTDSGIPLLKDIPLIGHLFKNRGKSKAMEDVLIFITPHILKEKSLTENDPDVLPRD